MNIIFGDAHKLVPNSFTVLELDTFRIAPSNDLVSTWCVVEKVPLEEFPTLANYTKIHADLISQYRSQNWQFCLEAIAHLLGKFNGELDSFYNDLHHRITKLQTQDFDQSWDWVLDKPIKNQSA